ncbi:MULTISPECIES: hypothetical protein [Cryobacterium]|uniref:hypothetical protein n=1 Tax=Cryobacterium TaxID=69578 RepID=UPI000CD48062|nr:MULTISPECIES: hypothetical protein [Cryobacterium]POH63631.1 hypothetical protein C3B60_16075 [Cryobacterium zongtaii]TFC45580.1 hypothetical protein E3O57_08010 [Cryobacterium sp. TMN-39-2]
MSWDDPFWYPHTVSIRNARPAGGMGTGYAVARTVKAEVKDEQRLVRTADGREVVSSSSVTVPIGEHVPVGSLVTVWPGASRQREAEVLAVGTNENGLDDLDSFLVLSLK